MKRVSIYLKHLCNLFLRDIKHLLNVSRDSLSASCLYFVIEVTKNGKKFRVFNKGELMTTRPSYSDLHMKLFRIEYHSLSFRWVNRCTSHIMDGLAYLIHSPSQWLESYVIYTPADVGQCLDSHIIHTLANSGHSGHLWCMEQSIQFSVVCAVDSLVLYEVYHRTGKLWYMAFQQYTVHLHRLSKSKDMATSGCSGCLKSIEWTIWLSMVCAVDGPLLYGAYYMIRKLWYTAFQQYTVYLDRLSKFKDMAKCYVLTRRLPDLGEGVLQMSLVWSTSAYFKQRRASKQ